MNGLLSDHNILGQMRILQRILEGSYWGDLWRALHCPILTFQDVGLATTASDVEIWRLCQTRHWILVTSNRNKENAEALEAVIESEGHATCLPVFTLADANRVLDSKQYAERIVERMLTLLMDIDNIRGTGRMYLP